MLFSNQLGRLTKCDRNQIIDQIIMLKVIQAIQSVEMRAVRPLKLFQAHLNFGMPLVRLKGANDGGRLADHGASAKEVLSK
jgi:hypothetical protein